MSYRVFVSASPEDADLAEDLARRLKKASVEVVPGQRASRSGARPSPAERLKELEGADEVLVLVTDRSLESLWAMYELGAAFSLNKPVTPIVMGVPKRELPSPLLHFPFVRYRDLEGFLAGLKARARNGADLPLRAAAS